MHVVFDLHVHSALSACAEDIMSPGRIVERARASGVTLLALTDHNASANTAPFLARARACGIAGIPGMEVASREDVHLLALFESIEVLGDFQHLVDDHLPADGNPVGIFGHQILYDAQDEIIDIDPRLRQTGTSIALETLVEQIHRRGGVAIPAHIDRARNSLTRQLGFVDPEAAYDALEITRHAWRREGRRPGETLEGFLLTTASDAHFLEDVGGGAMAVEAAAPTLPAVLAALRRLKRAESGENP